MSYSTFWNDFSHYSFYSDSSESQAEAIDAPMTYNSLKEEDMLFTDKEKFIHAPNDLIAYSEQPSGQNTIEQFSCQAPFDGHFCAHIPQDFNVDIRTTG